MERNILKNFVLVLLCMSLHAGISLAENILPPIQQYPETNQDLAYHEINQDLALKEKASLIFKDLIKKDVKNKALIPQHKNVEDIPILYCQSSKIFRNNDLSKLKMFDIITNCDDFNFFSLTINEHLEGGILAIADSYDVNHTFNTTLYIQGNYDNLADEVDIKEKSLIFTGTYSYTTIDGRNQTIYSFISVNNYEIAKVNEKKPAKLQQKK